MAFFIVRRTRQDMQHAPRVCTLVLFIVMALIRLRVPLEAERTQLRIMEAYRSFLGKSRIGFHSHRECIEEDHEYANKLGKQC